MTQPQLSLNCSPYIALSQPVLSPVPTPNTYPHKECKHLSNVRS